MRRHRPTSGGSPRRPPSQRRLLLALALSALARLRIAARLLLLLALSALVAVLPRLTLTGLSLPRLALTLASLLHGAHRHVSFRRRVRTGSSRSPRRAGDPVSGWPTGRSARS